MRQVKERFGRTLATAMAALSIVAAPGQLPADDSPVDPRSPRLTVHSPDGDLRAQVELDAEGRAGVRFSLRGRQVAAVAFGMGFPGGSLERGLRVVDTRHAKRDRSYSVAVGKTSKARDVHRELAVALEERAPPQRKFVIELRAFDDAFAFRYSVPKQAAFTELHLTGESTEFSFAGDPLLRAVPLASYTTSYEAHYVARSLSELSPGDQLYAMPMLLRSSVEANSAPVWMAITEADLTDHAGAYLVRNSAGSLSTRLSPLPDRDDEAAVIAPLPHASPWRVLFVGDSPGRFLESDVVFHLSEPCAIEDTSWIRPGRTTFPWWNAYALEGVDFEPGLNTATHKHYIDFCAEHGIEYHSLDGTDLAWYGGPINPTGPTDITTGIEGLDVEELFRYAKSKGVRLRLWSHWRAMRAQIDEALPLYERWGAEGIMVDFMDRDDQGMVAFYHEVARKAARHKLTVTFHGSYKPTGMERTWPNVLSYESALNQEYNKWDARGTPPSHNLDVAFVRMIAGPVDYHQGGMRHALPKDYAPKYKAPPVQGTRAHQLGMFVVYQNHLPMLADYPSAYRGQAGLDFLTTVPTSWDETRVLHAEVGASIVVARRKGATWYLGGMTGDEARSLRLPLTFLGEGHYEARWYEDPAGEAEASSVVAKRGRFASTDSVSVRMGIGGGFAGVWSLVE